MDRAEIKVDFPSMKRGNAGICAPGFANPPTLLPDLAGEAAPRGPRQAALSPDKHGAKGTTLQGSMRTEEFAGAWRTGAPVSSLAKSRY
jgi:hypothetical protein